MINATGNRINTMQRLTGMKIKKRKEAVIWKN